MKVGYLGPIGSFTYSATLAAFPDATLIPYASIPACLKAIEQQEVACSIIPIENTIEGTVNASIDYLYHQAQLLVQAELVLPIQQQLMVAKENRDLATKSENFITSASISSIADVSSEKLSRSDFRSNAFNSLRRQIHCRTSRITFCSYCTKTFCGNV